MRVIRAARVSNPPKLVCRVGVPYHTVSISICILSVLSEHFNDLNTPQMNDTTLGRSLALTL